MVGFGVAEVKIGVIVFVFNTLIISFLRLEYACWVYFLSIPLFLSVSYRMSPIGNIFVYGYI